MFKSITVASKPKLQPGALVLGYFKDQPLDATSKKLDSTGAGAAALKRGEATGDAGSVVEAFPDGKSRNAPGRILLVGLGDKTKFDVGSLRAAAGNVGRRLAAAKVQDASVELDGALASARTDAAQSGAAFGEGLGLIGWVCDEFKGKGGTIPTRGRLTVGAGNAEFRAGLSRGLALAESANFARTLSQTPPNIATPEYMAEQARKMARQAGLSFKVFEGQDLVRERFEGLINVGKASENSPRMIRLEYRLKGGSSKKPAVLIGKTMCYDSGGLSLKINNGMVGMKRDKDGGCAVLGAMRAIATEIKPRRPVVALLAAAENSISDEAYRPDDILTYRNGVTVEVTNTDAEGRLVLADALCWACEKESPAYIVDLATLTGGVVVALGATYAGMFCEDDRLRGRVEDASRASGERVWRLPMHEEYKEMMKSPVADIVNSNPNRKASPIQGAAFLDYFVRPGIPWCHLDIAGVHAVEKNAGCWVEGPTGWGTRLLANLLDLE